MLGRTLGARQFPRCAAGAVLRMAALCLADASAPGRLVAQEPEAPARAAPASPAAAPQPEPGALPPPSAANAPAGDAEVEARLRALEAELARQREVIAAQQRQLEAASVEASAEPGAADDADLAALIEEAKQDAEAPAEEPMLRFYGFADVGLQRLWADDAIAEISPETDKLTFVLGNVNLYFDASPSEDFRFLAEIRFGLFPDGSVARPKDGWSIGAPIDTSVSDPSAANAFFTNLRWAGVVPERAHIDWTPGDVFNLRSGLFLTPYGIWNVDHGTPTRIMVSEPLFLSAQLFPSRLIGVEAYGTLQFLPWSVGYHLHVSNGRTLSQVDFSDSKALGARVYLATRHPFVLKLGVSGYVGDGEDVETALNERRTVFTYDELCLSGDLSIDVGALRIRTEFVVNWVSYDDGKRRVWSGVALADVTRLGGYIVLAYELPWYGIEPLIMTEFIRLPVPRFLPIGEGMIMPAVGVNVYFTDTTMLRTQVSIARGFDLSSDPVSPEGFLYQAVARLITAF